MDDDVGTHPRRGEHHGSESVVHHHLHPSLVRDRTNLGYIRDRQGRVRHRLHVQHLRLPLPDRRPHRPEIPNLHERRRYVAGPRQEVGQQRVGPTVQAAGGHHVSAAAADLEQHRRDRSHPARRAVRRLRPLYRRHLPAEIQHRGVEVPAVYEEVAVGAQLAGEHPSHRLRLHHGEGGGGLDRHVHAAVLAELVPGARQRLRRVARGLRPLRRDGFGGERIVVSLLRAVGLVRSVSVCSFRHYRRMSTETKKKGKLRRNRNREAIDEEGEERVERIYRATPEIERFLPKKKKKKLRLFRLREMTELPFFSS